MAGAGIFVVISTLAMLLQQGDNDLQGSLSCRGSLQTKPEVEKQMSGNSRCVVMAIAIRDHWDKAVPGAWDHKPVPCTGCTANTQTLLSALKRLELLSLHFSLHEQVPLESCGFFLCLGNHVFPLSPLTISWSRPAWL